MQKITVSKNVLCVSPHPWYPSCSTVFLSMPRRKDSPDRPLVQLNIRILLSPLLQFRSSTLRSRTLGRWDRDSLFPQRSIRGNEPLNSAFEALTCVSTVQKPCSPRICRILNGLTSSRPTSLNQALFERLGQSLVDIKIGPKFQKRPGEFHGQRGILVLVRPCYP